MKSEWNKFVAAIYKKEKELNKEFKFKDALKKAAPLWKKGVRSVEGVVAGVVDETKKVVKKVGSMVGLKTRKHKKSHKGKSHKGKSHKGESHKGGKKTAKRARKSKSKSRKSRK